MDILESLKLGILTHRAEETQAVAEQVAASIPVDHALTLHGDLGSGKTTFVQGLARHWGIKQVVTSPTFAIFNIYNSGKRNLIHLDAYRLEEADSTEDLMLDEFMEPPWCLAIEWPEKFPDCSTYPCWAIQFERIGPDMHRLSSPAIGCH